MKRVINSAESIYAMAIVNPKLCKNRSIQVEVEQRDEGPIPHLHVYLDKTRNPKNCAYVRLDEPEYAPHHKSVKLSKTQKQEFIEIMQEGWRGRFIQSTLSEEVKQASGYQASVDIWIDTFGEWDQFSYDQDGFPVMPDYSQL